MSIDTQWKYKNIASPDTKFVSPDDFFNDNYTGVAAIEDVNQHRANNTKNMIEQDSFLLSDKKTIVTLRRFLTNHHYQEWKRVRSLLPKVDYNLSEEEGTFIEMDPGAWGNYHIQEEYN